MNSEHLSFHACPRCGDPRLTLDGLGECPQGADLQTGTIACVNCRASFDVRSGIARFVPAENYAISFGYQWNKHARTQLDSHTGLPISRDRLFGVTGWPKDLRGQSILEAGSGAGRFTEILSATGATVVSFDYSSAVDANRINNGARNNVYLFQGDIFNIPLRPGTFDKVICLGVIQHTPDPDRAFRSLAAQVRPGGELVIDVYSRRFLSMLQWKYILRPITTRAKRDALYAFINRVVPPLVPVVALLRRLAGRAGARLVPIAEYSHLGLPPALNLEWAILDTFDMYSPAHDHPQSLKTVGGWFEAARFSKIEVRYGPNGVIGKGVRSA